MAITPTAVPDGNFTDATDNPTSYASSLSWAASASTLYLAIIHWSYSSGTGANPSSVTGGGLTFTQYAKLVYNNRVLAVYYAADASPTGAAVTTVTPAMYRDIAYYKFYDTDPGW